MRRASDAKGEALFGSYSRLLLATTVLGLAASARASADTMLDKVTIPPNLVATTMPIILEGDQILVELEATRQDGSRRKILANVNFGATYSSWQKHVYDDIGFVHGQPVSFRLGGIPIWVAPGASGVTADAAYPERQDWPFFFTHNVEGELASGILEHFDLALDYADKTMTLAQPGALRHDGIAVPIRVNEETGLASVDFVVDGKPYPMVIDVGGAYTWVRPSVAAEWLHAHPEWERSKGAIGVSNYNMIDASYEKEGTILRIPSAMLHQMEVKNVGVLGIGSGPGPAEYGNAGAESLLDAWQKSAPEPVVGWLGANVLKHYRLTIDYKDRMSYWLEKSDIDPHELDQVGISLVYRAGDYFVGGIVRKGSLDTVTGLEAGDRIVEIDGVAMHGQSRDTILAALHGRPGDPRVLTVERDGKTLAVATTVIGF